MGLPDSDVDLEGELRPIGATRVCCVENVPERIAEYELERALKPRRGANCKWSGRHERVVCPPPHSMQMLFAVALLWGVEVKAAGLGVR